MARCKAKEPDLRVRCKRDLCHTGDHRSSNATWQLIFWSKDGSQAGQVSWPAWATPPARGGA
jgi:hypothetical protein